MPLGVGQQSPLLRGQAGYSAHDDVPILSVAVGRNVPLGDKVGPALGTVGPVTGVAVTADTGVVSAMIVTDAVTVLNKVAAAE
jgi:hypothetical protein